MLTLDGSQTPGGLPLGANEHRRVATLTEWPTGRCHTRKGYAIAVGVADPAVLRAGGAKRGRLRQP